MYKILTIIHVMYYLIFSIPVQISSSSTMTWLTVTEYNVSVSQMTKDMFYLSEFQVDLLLIFI
jgi:hypothetical protein